VRRTPASARTSPAKMSGGERRSSVSASCSAFGSAYSGICSAFLVRHESGDQAVEDGAGADATARGRTAATRADARREAGVRTRCRSAAGAAAPSGAAAITAGVLWCCDERRSATAGRRARGEAAGEEEGRAKGRSGGMQRRKFV
jgi:hypothetical protein